MAKHPANQRTSRLNPKWTDVQIGSGEWLILNELGLTIGMLTTETFPDLNAPVEETSVAPTTDDVDAAARALREK